MTKKDFELWFKYVKALEDGEYLEREDYKEVVRLNYLVMEAAHKIHNDNMLSGLSK